MSKKKNSGRGTGERDENDNVIDVRLPGYIGKGPFIWFSKIGCETGAGLFAPRSFVVSLLYNIVSYGYIYRFRAGGDRSAFVKMQYSVRAVSLTENFSAKSPERIVPFSRFACLYAIRCVNRAAWQI